MSNVRGLQEWEQTVARRMPHLSKPQAVVLAMLSFGMVIAHSCAITAVTCYLSALLQTKMDTQRQRMREFCYNAEDKQGDQRVSVDVERCFAPLLQWVMALWDGQQLALALDATTLADRFTVLAVSVVYRGCAIPVAWTVLRGNTKQAWRGEWQRMLRLLWRAVPKETTVIVLADRGLYARWLYRRIVRLRWHPLLRVNTRCHFRIAGAQCYAPMSSFAPSAGTQWSGKGTAFKTGGSSLECTLMACWGEGHKEAWFILTDLPPEAADACWYGMRAWIEHGFKVTKRGGWQWQRTRMADPERASRLWLAVAVATLWAVSVGEEADMNLSGSSLPDVVGIIDHSKRQRKATQARMISVFRRGCILIFVALIRNEHIPEGRLVPEPWPVTSRKGDMRAAVISYDIGKTYP